MSELYTLPDGWEWKKLGELAKFQSGGTPSRNNKTYWENGDIPWVKISDITDNMYVYKTKEFINKSGLNNSSAKLFSKGTILYTIFATIGKIGILDIEATTNQAISGIQPNQNVDLFYMYYGLKFITNEIQKISVGVAQNNINLTKLKEQWFPLPQLEEQKRIVAKLDILFAKIDKAITLHQKNIDEADIFMASVLNDIFAEFEEKYEKKQLNEIAIFGGKNISTLEYPNLIYFSLEDIETQTGKILNYKTVNESGVKGTAVSFDDNVVLYSKLRPYLNKVIVPNLEGCATTELVVLKPKDKLDKYFLASYLRSSNIVNFLNNDSMGAKMPRTNMKTFRNLDIPLPPLKTQKKVVLYLDEISNKMEKIKQIQKEKMQSLKELKASILDKAFKGEL
ncbi:restriction endonuclease subunit S [Aliarcobacter thereius]|uniref:EcoKI restriction-modification system protein HsdS n=1 Tax=Aliarcobacter thereius LMG 24486 TaxID=1032240 RepID=A0A1C7WRN3_9BACT|nr:restriction endonuclease subunit S [Aliarcobacter thereius]OCL95407.1 EcoKI restriction-modification system protein HsdS [Aliarcobacter thereius LMG 24486]QBF16605.1 type I restriction/modification system, S subunit [Aliarcobacter thereius LMG 24486]TLS93671.1 restriction endonuclease subunit S [Aliarcobacter thereius]